MDLSMKNFKSDVHQIIPYNSERVAFQRIKDENQEENPQIVPDENWIQENQVVTPQNVNCRDLQMLQGANRIGLPILKELNLRSPRIFRPGSATCSKNSIPLIVDGEKNADKQIRLINKRFQQYETHKTALQIIFDDRSHKLAQMVLDSCFSSNSRNPETQITQTSDTFTVNDVNMYSPNNTIEEPATLSGNHSKIRRSYAKHLKQEETATDLISIGPNGTRVSEKLISSMDWSVVNSATRKLLMIVFDRDTLASHSLTGRPSPAFIEKNDYVVKSKLDENKINDIIHLVKTKCKASEKHVRQAITIKLADEQKMKRQRDERASIVVQRGKKISKK